MHALLSFTNQWGRNSLSQSKLQLHVETAVTKCNYISRLAARVHAGIEVVSALHPYASKPVIANAWFIYHVLDNIDREKVRLGECSERGL